MPQGIGSVHHVLQLPKSQITHSSQKQLGTKLETMSSRAPSILRSSGKMGDRKHGPVRFRRTNMAHMALGHNNAGEFAAVEKKPH